MLNMGPEVEELDRKLERKFDMCIKYTTQLEFNRYYFITMYQNESVWQNMGPVFGLNFRLRWPKAPILGNEI